MPICGRLHRHRPLRCRCSAIQCSSRSLMGASSTDCMSMGVRKSNRVTSPEYFIEQRCAEYTSARSCTLDDSAGSTTSPLEHHLALEQMYLKIAPKIVVFAPNCWETLTEFSRHNSRTGW